jgi:hypothetical protein
MKNGSMEILLSLRWLVMSEPAVEWLLLVAYLATERSTLLIELTLLNPIGSHCRVSFYFHKIIIK